MNSLIVCMCNREDTDLTHINDSFLINSFIGKTV